MREDEKACIFRRNRWVFGEILLETITGRHKPSKNSMIHEKHRLYPIKPMEQTDNIRGNAMQSGQKTRKRSSGKMRKSKYEKIGRIYQFSLFYICFHMC